MTDDEAITLAILHAPSTIHEAGDRTRQEEDTQIDPFYYGVAGCWWVYRHKASAPDFDTKGEAAQHYCKFYNITLDEPTGTPVA
jgi:hypothetical protein